MKIEIRLRIDAGESNSCEEEVWVLDKAHDQLEQLGLSLDEAKALLGRLQERVVAAQAAASLDDNQLLRRLRRTSLEQGPGLVHVPYALW